MSEVELCDEMNRAADTLCVLAEFCRLYATEDASETSAWGGVVLDGRR